MALFIWKQWKHCCAYARNAMQNRYYIFNQKYDAIAEQNKFEHQNPSIELNDP